MQIPVRGGTGFIDSHFAERFVGDRHDADAEHTHADTTKITKLPGYEPSPHHPRECRNVRQVSQNYEWCEPLVRAA